MIPLATFREVQRLLGEGQLSQRKIAKVVGVSRATVGAIARGKHTDREARQLQREQEREDAYLPSGPLERCPGCGSMVYMPCLLCRVREKLHRDARIVCASRRNSRQQALRHLLTAMRRAHWDDDGRGPLRRAG